MYYPFYTFVSQGHGSVNELTLRDWTRCSSSGWLDHKSDELHRQPTGRSARRSLHRRPIGWIAHRMGFIVSYAGESPAKPWTPRCSDVPRDDPVSSSSLHVHERLPSALWVVGSGSLVMLCSSYTHTGSALRIMVNRLARAEDSATH